MSRKSIEAHVSAVAAALEGRMIETTKPRRKRKPVVCEAAYAESAKDWDYLEATYDLLLEFGVIPSSTTQ